MKHKLSFDGDLSSKLLFSDSVQTVNDFYTADATHQSNLKTKIITPSYELLAQLDGSVFGYFDSTIEVRSYDGDLSCYLGNTDISNELTYEMMQRMVEDCQ